MRCAPRSNFELLLNQVTHIKARYKLISLTEIEQQRITTSVVIPVYYNQASIAAVVRNVTQAWMTANRNEDELEFVIVDDGSLDASWQVIKSLYAENPERVTALRLVKNHGSQLAILAGASQARGEYIAMVAADAQEPASLVAEMKEAIERGGVELVLAVRGTRADALTTRMSAGVFYRVMRLLGLRQMPGKGFDAFMMSRNLMNVILDLRDPNIPLSTIIAWLGYPYKEVLYNRLARDEGTSRWTLSKKIKLFLDSVTAISYMPIRFISLAGVVVAVIGFLYALFIIFARVFGFITIEGWASILVATLVLGGMQLISLGVIGEYLWRTLEVARHRPLWLVAERLAPPASASQTSGISESQKPIDALRRIVNAGEKL